MATTMSQLVVPWHHMSRPQSQPGPVGRDPRRVERKSPNRVKSRPADPIVINSILDSFDALTPSPLLSPDEPFFGDTGGRLRPHTADERMASTSSLASLSPGFGMEYGAGLSMDDESGLSNAALPPTVRTIRDPYAMINYKPSRPSSFWSTNGDEMKRSSSLNSCNSFSIRGKSRDRPKKYKLSSESWVKQGTMSQESLQSQWSREDGPSIIRRKDSHESLKPPKSRIEFMPTPSMSSTLSRAEQIIALTPPPRRASSRRRIYLTDTASEKSNSVLDSSTAIAEAPEPEEIIPEIPQSSLPAQMDTVEMELQQTLDEYVQIEEDQQVQTRRSPEKANVIVDSIPMRTSSLRHSSSSPGRSKKKDKKSKRRSEIGRMAKMRASSQRGSQRDSLVSESSREISDSRWNDLGDDDETVKRIRELREQRQARMLEPNPNPIRGISPAANSEISTTSSIDRASDLVQRSPVLRPEAPRSVTEPSPLSKKVLQYETELVVPAINHALDRRKPRGLSPEAKRHSTNFSLDETRLQARPLSAKSNGSSNLALSLDYSYIDAVDALQGARRETQKHPSSSSVSPIHPLTPTLTTPVPLSKTQSPKSASIASRSKPFRWKSPSQFADLPLAFDKKDRRRSASLDHSRGDLAVQPDGVEVAVDDYLRAKRLNRKIKHPISGRVISFSEVGDPNGAAVIVCLGMGLTRFVSAFYDELAATLRLRLVTIDRPGVGNSEPLPANSKSGPLSWPDDVLAVCQELGISKFSMLAHSAGAIYSLATALILPHLIKGKLHLLSPWIPPSQLDALSNRAVSIAPAGMLPRSQRLLRVLPTPFFKAANASFMTAASASLKPNSKVKTKAEKRLGTPPTSGRDRPPTSERPGLEGNRRESMMLMDQFMPDINPTDNFPVQGQQIGGANGLHSPAPLVLPTGPNFEFASTGLNAPENIETERKQEYITLLTQRTWELATRDSNPATDLLVCLERHRDIGFRYTDVHQEVVITHGSEDKRVPVGNVRWLAEQMNRHSVAFGTSSIKSGNTGTGLVGGGCEIRVLQGEAHGLMASPLIMGDILTEIAGYWRGGRDA